jgi:hypothetical protein
MLSLIGRMQLPFRGATLQQMYIVPNFISKLKNKKYIGTLFMATIGILILFYRGW